MTFFPVFLLFCYPFFPKINLPKLPLKKTSLFCFLLLFAIQSFPPPNENNFTGPVKFCSVCNLKRCVFCRFFPLFPLFCSPFFPKLIFPKLPIKKLLLFFFFYLQFDYTTKIFSPDFLSAFLFPSFFLIFSPQIIVSPQKSFSILFYFALPLSFSSC